MNPEEKEVLAVLQNKNYCFIEFEPNGGKGHPFVVKKRTEWMSWEDALAAQHSKKPPRWGLWYREDAKYFGYI